MSAKTSLKEILFGVSVTLVLALVAISVNGAIAANGPGEFIAHSGLSTDSTFQVAASAGPVGRRGSR